MEPQLFVGIDVGKTDHHATAVNHDGEVVYDKPLPQSEPKIQELLKDLVAKHGELLVVVDQPKTIGALVIAVAQQLRIQVAYLPGLMMRRVADLHPGKLKRMPAMLTLSRKQPAPCPTRCAVLPWLKRTLPSYRCCVGLMMI